MVNLFLFMPGPQVGRLLLSHGHACLVTLPIDSEVFLVYPMSRADKPLVGQHEVVSYGTCHPEMLRTIDSACPSKDASTFGAMATCEHVLDGGQKVRFLFL